MIFYADPPRMNYVAPSSVAEVDKAIIFLCITQNLLSLLYMRHLYYPCLPPHNTMP